MVQYSVEWHQNLASSLLYSAAQHCTPYLQRAFSVDFYSAHGCRSDVQKRAIWIVVKIAPILVSQSVVYGGYLVGLGISQVL